RAPRLLDTQSFRTRRSSDLGQRIGGGAGRSGHYHAVGLLAVHELTVYEQLELYHPRRLARVQHHVIERLAGTQLLLAPADDGVQDRKSTRLNSSHVKSSYAV